jgi:hypothetical protein
MQFVRVDRPPRAGRFTDVRTQPHAMESPAGRLPTASSDMFSTSLACKSSARDVPFHGVVPRARCRYATTDTRQAGHRVRRRGGPLIAPYSPKTVCCQSGAWWQ